MQETGSTSYSRQSLSEMPGRLDWLHPEERKFLDTLRFEKRRNDWLLGRWTAKQALLSFFESQGIGGVAPPTIAILKGAKGAPEVWLEEGLPSCSLSISHRAGHAISVVAPGIVPIGCDLELIEPRSEAFLSDYFLECELAFLAGVAHGEKDLYANLIWCIKESVMKATGEGMGLHPRGVEAKVLDQERVEGIVLSEGIDFQGFWSKEEVLVWVAISK